MKGLSIYKKILVLCTLVTLGGCIQKTVKPDDPFYAPIPSQKLERPKPVTGSIYDVSSSRDMYGNGRATQVGDIISILLNESTTASKKAKTTADKTNSTTLTAPTIFGEQYSGLATSIAGPTTAFEGEGKSDISNSLNGTISVTVHQVLPNGVLVVRGEKWLKLNQGDEYIQVSGMIRPQDIAADNTVSSEKLADARISYSGTGSVSDTNVVGWLSKFFISALMPF